MKRLLRAFVASLVLLLGLPTPAHADPLTVTIFLAEYIGYTAAAFIVSYAGTIALVSLTAYGTINARNKAKRAQAAARNAYNAGLQDRNVTALGAAPGRRIIYGRADTGGDVVAMFTTDKTAHGPGSFRGVEVTKPDSYKHLIVVWSSRQCQAIHGIKIDGIPVGELDSNGWATVDEWKKSDPKPTGYGQLSGEVRSHTLPSGSTIISVTLISGVPVGPGETGQPGAHTPISSGAGGWIFSGTTLTLPGSVNVAGFAYTPTALDIWDISYSADDIDGTSCVRVRHHLGAPDQVADAELMALLPTKWTSAHRLRGRCYSWITLDLERAQFQGGPPGLTADISGALLLDPRTDTTGWSDNPALCGYDYLRTVEGMNVTAAEVDVASVIAAANECDVSTTFSIGGVTVTGPRYSCNGVFTAGQAKEAVLIDIAESMGGFATYSGTWRLLAGAWQPPVMDLVDADLHGSIDIIQAGEPSGELFNSVRGQYVPASSSVASDIETYSNATFMAADGKALYTDIELPFTNSRARAKNISRIKVEQSRAGLVIFYPAKLRAWPLQTGDRVRVTSAEYGFSLKTFRVTDWAFGLRSPVGLTLQEDAADIYDEADAAVADPTPNTDLPNPWTVPALALPTADSGTAQLQRLGDGTIISRVLVSWPRTEAAYMEGGRIEVLWREAGSTVMHTAQADGTDTQVYLTGVRDGAFIGIQLTAINTQRARSAPRSIGHLVLGKSAAPAAVAGLAAVVVPGALRITRTPSVEVDYASTVYRYGASWAAGTVVPGTSDERGCLWAWPAPGTYTIWAADLDTTGHTGTPVSFGPVTVTSAALAPANAALSIKLNVGDFSGTVNYSEAYIHGRDSSGAAVDAPGAILINGVATAVPNGNLYTNQGPVAGYIVWDSTGSTFSTGPGLRPYVLARRRAGAWEFDDNGAAGSSGWTVFTPAATHWIIGTLESASPDTGNPGSGPALVAASIWAAASTLNSLEAGADAAYAAAAAAQSTANKSGGTNLFSGLLASPFATDGATITNPSRADPYGTNNAVEVTTQSGTNGYLYYHLVGLQPGYYTVKLKLLVTIGQSVIVSTTNGLAWIGGSYTTATTTVADQWIQVVLRQLVGAVGYLDVAVGAWHGPGGPVYSSPNPTTVAISDLWVEREDVGIQLGLDAAAAAEAYALAQATLAELTAKAYADGIVSDEEARAIADATAKADAARDAAIAAAAADATTKASAAQTAAQTYAAAQAAAADTSARAYADGIVTDEETRAIADATAKASAAQAAAIAAAAADATSKANLAQLAAEAYAAAEAAAADTAARAYADGIVTAEETRAIADAQAKADAAQAAAEAAAAADATAKADLAALTAEWSGVSGTGRPIDYATRSIVTQDNYAFSGASVSAIPTVQRSFSVTPAVNCTINFSAVIGAAGVNPDAGSYLGWFVSAGGGADTGLAAAPGGSARQTFTGLASFSATGGVALTFKLISDRASGNPAMTLYDSSMRVEQVLAP